MATVFCEIKSRSGSGVPSAPADGTKKPDKERWITCAMILVLVFLEYRSLEKMDIALLCDQRRTLMTIRTIICVCVLMLCLGAVAAAQEKAESDSLQEQAQERSEKQHELLIREISILRRQIDSLKQYDEADHNLPAMKAILDYKLSQEGLQRSLSGAKIVAADGAYLGLLAPAYDNESIFCSYGPYGAAHSEKSIWCSYGIYGATHNELSPFCPYSTRPPKIMVNGQAVASLTTGFHGWPVSISPYTLKEIFAGN